MMNTSFHMTFDQRCQNLRTALQWTIVVLVFLYKIAKIKALRLPHCFNSIFWVCMVWTECPKNTTPYVYIDVGET